jgi:hypothetical protein
MICIRKLFFAAGAAAITAGLYSTAATAATVTADAQATVIQPLVVTQTNGGMNFGDLSVGTVGGTLILTPGGGLTASADVDTAGGTVQAGNYNVAGEAGKVYTISFDASATLNSAGNTMTVDTFTDDAPASPTVPSSFNVGGTLNVDPSQAAGTYTGSYTITVNYQ